MPSDRRAEQTEGEAAVVTFLDGAQAAHLRNVQVGNGLVTGLRWQGQAEEGTYSYPLIRVEAIRWA